MSERWQRGHGMARHERELKKDPKAELRATDAI